VIDAIPKPPTETGNLRPKAADRGIERAGLSQRGPVHPGPVKDFARQGVGHLPVGDYGHAVHENIGHTHGKLIWFGVIREIVHLFGVEDHDIADSSTT